MKSQLETQMWLAEVFRVREKTGEHCTSSTEARRRAEDERKQNLTQQSVQVLREVKHTFTKSADFTRK